MRARVGEGAALGKAPLERDDAANRLEALWRLQHLPAGQVAEADLENVEVEGWIEIVAIGPFAPEIVDPGRNAALEIDVVVERYRHLALVVAAMHLVGGIEVEQRLVEYVLGRAGL